MYEYICIYIYMYIYTCIYIHIHTHTLTHTHSLHLRARRAHTNIFINTLQTAADIFCSLVTRIALVSTRAHACLHRHRVAKETNCPYLTGHSPQKGPVTSGSFAEKNLHNKSKQSLLQRCRNQLMLNCWNFLSSSY